MTMKRSLLAALLLLCLTPTLHAQNGCINSPENPTAVLLLVGGGAAALVKRFKGRRG